MLLEIIGRGKGPLHLDRRSIRRRIEVVRGPVRVKQTNVKHLITKQTQQQGVRCTFHTLTTAYLYKSNRIVEMKLYLIDV